MNAKGGFKSEDTGRFLLLQNTITEHYHGAENMNFPPQTVKNLFSAEDSDLEYFFEEVKIL